MDILGLGADKYVMGLKEIAASSDVAAPDILQ
jgi:hypothetical protein